MLKDELILTDNLPFFEFEFYGTTFHDGNDWDKSRKPIPKNGNYYIWDTSHTNFQLVPEDKPNHKFRFSISKRQAKIIRKVKKE